jgi:hypothetical protein
MLVVDKDRSTDPLEIQIKIGAFYSSRSKLDNLECLYTSVFRQGILWYSVVRLTVCLSVHLSGLVGKIETKP